MLTAFDVFCEDDFHVSNRFYVLPMTFLFDLFSQGRNDHLAAFFAFFAFFACCVGGVGFGGGAGAAEASSSGSAIPPLKLQLLNPAHELSQVVAALSAGGRSSLYPGSGRNVDARA